MIKYGLCMAKTIKLPKHHFKFISTKKYGVLEHNKTLEILKDKLGLLKFLFSKEMIKKFE